MTRKRFCDINPFFFEISRRKGICLRHIKDFKNGVKTSIEKSDEKLPNLVWSYDSGIIKTGRGIDPVLQQNKAHNIELANRKLNGLIVRPNETFSFWRTVGPAVKRRGYRDGRVIVGGKLIAGMGGGLCNLANTINLLVLHSPLDITELHTHSDALAPDHGPRVPFGTGTSVSYNYIDYRFKNNTDQAVQLCLWCADGRLFGELRSEREFPFRYELTEEDHHFEKQGEKFYRLSKIYRSTYDRATGKLIDRATVHDNRSEVMFDYDLIPPELIR